MTYFEYMKNGLPLAILMTVFAFFSITLLYPSEHALMPGGKEYIDQKLKELGPWSTEEKKVGVIMGITILLWMTDAFHGISAQTVALLSCFLILCPHIGAYEFKDIVKTVPWGTILLCGFSMGIATAMVTYGTADWMVNQLVAITHITSLPLPVIVLVMLVIMSLCACAFTVRASAVNALIPCVAALALTLQEHLGGDFSPAGFTMVMFYPLLFTVILPVHTPYTLIPRATDGFEDRDLVKVQIPYVVLSILSCALLYFTYWHWVGLT